MISILKKLWFLLNRREKVISIILLVMMLLSSGLELMGIGLIMPVIAIITKPELIEQNRYLSATYNFINPDSHNQFIIILCITLICLYLFKNAFLSFQNYVQAHFIMRKGSDFANKMFTNYINAPYKYHLSRNSGYLMANVNLSRIFSVNVLIPLMILATETVVVLAILGMLLILSPYVTLGITAAVLLITFGIYLPLKNVNYKLGKRMKEENQEINKYALQGLKAIKESKIRNAEDYFAEQHHLHRVNYNNIMAKNLFLGNFPRFLIEASIIVLGLGALLILMLLDMSIGSLILIISLFAASAIRMMPSMSKIQYNLSRIKQGLHSFNTLYRDVVGFETEKKADTGEKFKFQNSIKLKNISFAYDNTENNIFSDFSLEIEKNESIAFVGPTGCGKTTIVDIVLGLLKPLNGSIEVDKVNIEDNLVGWQNILGYVPQFIFLLDDTVKANVAFGEAENKINDEKVVECLKMAQVYDFVSTLPKGIDNEIGENGIQLSGGQRQRIGIARALYRNPEVLILDEATSALDNNTEKAFIDALNKFHGKMTIIMIAHRLTTVENCDKIIEI